MIAMALACKPKLLIADEPTTALDVTIQAQILDLLRELVAERDTALIMITHDLGVVAGMCERVNVMYAGHVHGDGSADAALRATRGTRTRSGCSRASRGSTRGAKQKLKPIEGQPRNMLEPAGACPFQPRCRYEVELARRRCRRWSRSSAATTSRCFNPVPGATSGRGAARLGEAA